MADKPKTLEEAIERINALEQQNAKKDKITYENAQKALEAETQTLKQLELIKKKKVFILCAIIAVGFAACNTETSTTTTTDSTTVVTADTTSDSVWDLRVLITACVAVDPAG